jgi:flavin-dependent dehydrogenase
VTSVYFGRDVAPGGFAWVVPSAPGKARVGLVSSSDAAAHFELLRERLGWPELESGEPKYKAIAQGAVAKSVSDRVLVLGEAAGQVKTTTGGGVFFGLACSRIAAEAVRGAFRSGDFSAAGLSAYESGWRSLLRREIRVGEAARRILTGLSDAKLDRLFDLARNDGMIPIVRDRGNFDWHSDLILALLKRLPFSLVGQWLRRRAGSGDAN